MVHICSGWKTPLNGTMKSIGKPGKLKTVELSNKSNKLSFHKVEKKIFDVHR